MEQERDLLEAARAMLAPPQKEMTHDERARRYQVAAALALIDIAESLRVLSAKREG